MTEQNPPAYKPPVSTVLMVWCFILLMTSSFAVLFYWALENSSNPGIELTNAHVVGSSDFMGGDVLRVGYTIVRRRDCTLQISRMLQAMNGRNMGREHRLAVVEISFTGDDKPRDVGYAVELPDSLPEDPTLKTVNFDVFNRVRYFCNGLDRVWPRYMMTNGKAETARLPITITRKD